MTYEEINKIPEKVKNKEITFEKAAWLLLTEVYFNLYKYTGEKTSADLRSDLIMKLQPKIKKLIERYDPKISLFHTFFKLYVHNTYNSFKRDSKKYDYTKHTLNCQSWMLFQEIIDNYNAEEACNGYDCIETDENLPKLIKYKITHNPDVIEKELVFEKLNKSSMKKAKPRTTNNKESLFWPGKTTEQKKLTILALKACYYIKENQIEYVTKFCGYKNNQLKEKIEELCQELEQKEQIRISFLRTRDNSYFYHRKYELILSALEKESPWYEKIKEKYLTHTKAWKDKNQMIFNNRFKICPSDEAIARVIGMSTRQVSNYIAKIKKDINESKENNIFK